MRDMTGLRDMEWTRLKDLDWTEGPGPCHEGYDWTEGYGVD